MEQAIIHKNFRSNLVEHDAYYYSPTEINAGKKKSYSEDVPIIML